MKHDINVLAFACRRVVAAWNCNKVLVSTPPRCHVVCARPEERTAVDALTPPIRAPGRTILEHCAARALRRRVRVWERIALFKTTPKCLQVA